MTLSDDNVIGGAGIAEPPAPIGLDADYDAAMNSVRAAIETFRGCSPEERAALQRDLDQLHAMAEKLAAGKVEIVVFGEISTGKIGAHQCARGRSGRGSECPRRMDQGRVEGRLERRRLLRARTGELAGRADRYARSQ